MCAQARLGSGLPSHQLTHPAEQHVHVGHNFPFLPLKMMRGKKKYQRETNEIISSIFAPVQSPSHKQRANGELIKPR